MLTIILIVGSASLISGVLTILGTILKWKVLIDPPQNMWWLFYSQLWIRLRFGSKAVIIYNYISGSIMALAPLSILSSIATGKIILPK